MVKQASHLILLLGCFIAMMIMLSPHKAHASVVPTLPTECATFRTACLATPELRDTCDCDTYAWEMCGKKAHVDLVQQTASDNSSDKQAFDAAVTLNIGLGNYGRCQVKIDALKTYQDAMTLFGGGPIAGPLAAAQRTAIDSIIATLVGGACNALISGVQALIATICLPTVSLTMPTPNYSFPIYPGACGGPPLANVTGGLVLYNPPAGYGGAIPQPSDTGDTFIQP